MSAQTPTPAELAKRNTLACLAANRDGYRAAGNLELADRFGEAMEARLQMIEAGLAEAGTWVSRGLTDAQLAEGHQTAERA